MYLLDTNIWLERLLAQAKAAEVDEFIQCIPSNQLSITDFAFHSLCVIMARLQRNRAIIDFVQDVLLTDQCRLFLFHRKPAI